MDYNVKHIVVGCYLKLNLIWNSNAFTRKDIVALNEIRMKFWINRFAKGNKILFLIRVKENGNLSLI